MSKRDLRRAKRVEDHCKRKWDDIVERRSIFNEMNDITIQSMLSMITGLPPTGFVLDRDCDESDCMRNTPLFKSELARYLSTIVATEAEYQDPDGVDELIALVEQTDLPLTYNLPTEVLESATTLTSGDVITISKVNERNGVEAQPLNLAVVPELIELPTELQLAITDQLSCAQKIVLNAHEPLVAIKQCEEGRSSAEITLCLDERPHYKVALYEQNGTIHSEKQFIYQGFCHQKRQNYVSYPMILKPVRKSDIPIEDLPYWRRDMKMLSYPSRRKRGCICNTLLFKNPSLLRERSILRSLTMTGVGPPRNDHICFRVTTTRKK